MNPLRCLRFDSKAPHLGSWREPWLAGSLEADFRSGTFRRMISIVVVIVTLVNKLSTYNYYVSNTLALVVYRIEMKSSLGIRVGGINWEISLFNSLENSHVRVLICNMI